MGEIGHWSNPGGIFFMTKEEVLQALKSSREVSTMDDTKNWREAFALYNVARGTKLKAQDRCQKCFSKVLEWLQE